LPKCIWSTYRILHDDANRRRDVRPCITVKADRSVRWFKKFGTSLTLAKFTTVLNLPFRHGRGLSSTLVLARMTLTIRKLKEHHFVPTVRAEGKEEVVHVVCPRRKVQTNSFVVSPLPPLPLWHSASKCYAFYVR